MKNEVIVMHNDPKIIEADLKKINRDNLSYSDYVEMGKELVKRNEVYQARIAFYACKVCQIRHGGKSSQFYTLTDYAKDIGVNPRTLHEWTLVYRNVIAKLDINIDQVTKNVWKVASRVNDNLEWQHRQNNKLEGTQRKKSKQYKSSIDSKLVQKMFKDEEDEPSLISEVRAWTCSIRNMKNKIPLRELKLVHRANLIELMRMLDEVSDHINDFLTNNKEY